ncbi:hypothetical protein [Mesorhizobium sp. M0643]|uniref:hypothetical protein n=1 Tax=Mesorhizobium sp. M0643 TaxID=2956978 RepID=UPI003337EBC9
MFQHNQQTRRTLCKKFSSLSSLRVCKCGFALSASNYKMRCKRPLPFSKKDKSTNLARTLCEEDWGCHPLLILYEVAIYKPGSDYGRHDNQKGAEPEDVRAALKGWAWFGVLMSIVFGVAYVLIEN